MTNTTQNSATELQLNTAMASSNKKTWTEPVMVDVDISVATLIGGPGVGDGDALSIS